MSNIRMVVFDMAGTTVNEDNVVYKTLQQILAENGHALPLETVLDLAAGKEKKDAIRDLIELSEATQPNEAYITTLHESFKAALEKAYNVLEVTSFQGTESVFDYLQQKDIKVVLNTGYDKSTAVSLVEKLNWKEGRQFDLLVTADDVQHGRPDPAMILLAMEKLAIDEAAHVAKIGDSAVDIEEGKAAGCGLTMGITTGAQTIEQLSKAQPDYILDSLSEIATYI